MKAGRRQLTAHRWNNGVVEWWINGFWGNGITNQIIREVKSLFSASFTQYSLAQTGLIACHFLNYVQAIFPEEANNSKSRQGGPTFHYSITPCGLQTNNVTISTIILLDCRNFDILPWRVAVLDNIVFDNLAIQGHARPVQFTGCLGSVPVRGN